MEIEPIKTEEDYQQTLREISGLMNSEPETDEFDRLEILGTLISSYEAKHHPIEPPDAVAAIEYEMDKRGWGRKDLEPYIGTSGRVSEVLNRQRPLSMSMVRNLHFGLGISADVLIAKYPTGEHPTDALTDSASDSSTTKPQHNAGSARKGTMPRTLSTPTLIAENAARKTSSKSLSTSR